jgi:hypothetical protein
MTFTYSDDEWAAVAAALPNGAAWVRRVLELHGNTYVQQVDGKKGKKGRSYKRSQAAWRRIAKAARRLGSDIDAVGQHPLEIIYAFDRADREKLESFIVSLPWFTERADAMAARLGKWDAESKKRSNNKDVERDHYFAALMHEWEAQGGRVTVTVRDTGEVVGDGYEGKTRKVADGKLLRYLSIASAPVIVACGELPLKPDALAHEVRKHPGYGG